MQRSVRMLRNCRMRRTGEYFDSRSRPTYIQRGKQLDPQYPAALQVLQLAQAPAVDRSQEDFYSNYAKRVSTIGRVKSSSYLQKADTNMQPAAIKAGVRNDRTQSR